MRFSPALRKIAAALTALLLLVPAVSFADDESEVTFLLSERNALLEWRLQDGDTNSRIRVRTDEPLEVRFDEGQQGALLQWYSVPVNAEVTYLDGSGSPISSETREFTHLNSFLPLEGGCAGLSVRMLEEASVSEVSVYSASEPLPDHVQVWEDVSDTPALMVIVSEPGPELSMLSGVLPIYAGEHTLSTLVVYATTWGDRARAETALAGLWASGVRNYPIFLEYESRNYEMASTLESDWGMEKLTADLRGLLALYRPTVTVTLDPNDIGDPHPTRGFTAAAAVAAYELAPDVTEKFYTYCADGTSDGTLIDTSVPLTRFENQTAYDAANRIYRAEYPHQLTFARMADPAPRFMLIGSNGISDAAANDLFEGLNVSALSGYTAPAVPEPPVEAEETPAPQTDSAVTPVPSADSEEAVSTEADTAQGRGVTVRTVLPLMLGTLITLVLLFVLRRRCDRAGWLMLMFAPAILGIVVFFVLGGSIDTDAADKRTVSAPATAAPTAEPTPTPTPTATPTPEPTPTPVPTPTPDPDAQYYLADDDPGEEIVRNDATGHWSYRTNTLSIDINRIETQNTRGKIVTYFAADIRMKNIGEFRPGYGSEGHTGRGSIPPWIIARRAKAVLFITGDNMINDDREEKGVIIRDGNIYLRNDHEDMLAFNSDLSLSIYPRYQQDPEDLIESGIRNTFSFGPTLIDNGVINDKANKHRTRRANPRVGIGQYEPGHYLVLVVDGRQKGYSLGLTLDEFAALFAEYGCPLAYNFDGGLSACMIFMGEQLNHHGGTRIGSNNDLSYQRSVPDGLIFGYSEAVPSPDDPILNDGNAE